MEHRRLGRTGLRVSSVGLGTMTWGRDTDELEAKEQLDIFLDAGGTLVDTAASYGEGVSEEVIGMLLREHVDRQDLVLVSKAGVRTWRTGERSSVADASRGSLLDTPAWPAWAPITWTSCWSRCPIPAPPWRRRPTH